MSLFSHLGGVIPDLDPSLRKVSLSGGRGHSR